MISTEEMEYNRAKKRHEILIKKFKDIVNEYNELSEKDKLFFPLSEREINSMLFNIEYYAPKRNYITDEDMQTEELNLEELEKREYRLNEIMELFHECSNALNNLQQCDRALEISNSSIIIDENFLEESPSGEISRNEIYDTSILDNYRNWGIDRICLDGFQNHLPGDSKGTRCFLQFLVDDKWVNVEEAKLQKDKITKIRFADDGVGFSNKHLKFLSSQKTSEDSSVGQFGEGLKLISMASVNLGLGIEIQSQNWIAKPYGKPEKITNYRNGEPIEEERNQLTWDVTIYDGKPIKRFKNNI